MINRLKLPDRWGEFLSDQPESGMGYWIVTVILRDGKKFERVIIVGDTITQVGDLAEIPFAAEDITQIIVNP